jgi:glycerate kinase
VDAAAALVRGFARAGVEAEALPVADGGEGTAAALASVLGGTWHTARVSDALGRPVEARFLVLPDGTAVVECAEAIGLARLTPDELDPLRASSRGLGELLLAALELRPHAILLGLGGSATVDGGAGLRETVGSALEDVRVVVACDVRNPLLGERGAARVFGPQKGASPEAVDELERRLAAIPELAPFAALPGAGAAGGLGAALAALGAELVGGAELVLDRLRFRERAAGVQLVVTGEGTVDRTTLEGKAPGAVARACRELGVPCAVFGGIVRERPEGWDVHALSGEPARAAADLEALGERLARPLLGLA